jgi:hypothetical protein
MSLSVRTAGSRPLKPPTTRTRKIVITLVVLVSLVLVGTIVVLSSVSYYLNIPASAYLTEEEVPWRPQDVIRSLYEPPSIEPRQEWDEADSPLPSASASASASDPVMGSDTLAEVWEELEELEEELEDEDEYDDLVDSPAVNITRPPAISQVDEGGWGVDGKGTGGYWMKADWEGQVRDTGSWERLYNVTTR